MTAPSVTLRCTRKLLDRLGAGARARIARDGEPDAPVTPPVLGDWYATVLVVARRPLVLCVAERSLLAVVVPLREARTVVSRWHEAVARRLLALGVAEDCVSAEVAWVARAGVTPVVYERGGVPDRAAAVDTPSEPRRPIRIGARFAGSAPARREPDVGRRMVGVLNDMAWMCDGEPLRLDDSGALAPDLAAMEAALDRLPCGALGHACPVEVTRTLFGLPGAAAGEPDGGDGAASGVPIRVPGASGPELRVLR